MLALEKFSSNVLGGLMMDNSKINDIDLSSKHFFNQTHRQIFTAINNLIHDGKPADFLTVGDKLEHDTGKKWIHYTAQIIEDTISSSSIVDYSESLKNHYIEGEKKRICHDLIDNSINLDEGTRRLMALGMNKHSYECNMGEAVRVAVEMVDIASQKTGVTGIASGLSGLDYYTNGFTSPDLVVIGARPAMGKTALLLNLALNGKVKAGIISSEQERGQIGMRCIAIDGSISAHNMRNGELSENDYSKLADSAANIAKSNIMINDHPLPTIDEVIRQARAWKFTHDIKILYVDYIQRIKADMNMPKHERVEYIAMGLKSLAKELEIPVIALAQVNREVEKRQCSRPYMGDLKDSGGIEQEADIVMTLYREEVYSGNDKGDVEINVCKNRHGPVGVVTVSWIGEYMKFVDNNDRDFCDA